MTKRNLLLLLAFLLTLNGCGMPEEEQQQEAVGSEIVSSEQVPEAEASEPAPEPLFLTVEEVSRMEAGTVLAEEKLPEEIEPFFYAVEIPDEVFEGMEGVSYREGCPVLREQLRYVRVLHVGFDGQPHIGELVCSKTIAEDLVEIFLSLYQQSYPIEKMLLVDRYDGDDERSMEDNNTSCFNFRLVSGTSTISQHGYGLALDINPLYNPYITSRGFEPANAGDYVDRSKDTPYKITSSDPCYLEFEAHDFAWGGWWNSVKDYQHFEK